MSAPAWRRGSAFPRGLVLGLTMAETVLLVLFGTLLLFAVLFAWTRKDVGVPPGSAPVPKISVEQRRLLEALVRAGLTPELIQGITPELLVAVKGLEGALEGGTGESVSGLLKEIADLFGGSTPEEVGERIRTAGGGTENPSCLWARDRERETAYLFRVTLGNRGFFVMGPREAEYREDSKLPPAERVDAVETGRWLEQSAFVRQTERLKEWADEHKCTFFVQVWDGTGDGAKEVYKERMRILEGSFYKSLVAGAPPLPGSSPQ